MTCSCVAIKIVMNKNLKKRREKEGNSSMETPEVDNEMESWLINSSPRTTTVGAVGMLMIL